MWFVAKGEAGQKWAVAAYGNRRYAYGKSEPLFVCGVGALVPTEG